MNWNFPPLLRTAGTSWHRWAPRWTTPPPWGGGSSLHPRPARIVWAGFRAFFVVHAVLGYNGYKILHPVPARGHVEAAFARLPARAAAFWPSRSRMSASGVAVGPWGLLQRPGAGTRRQRCPRTLPSQNLDGPRPGMCRHGSSAPDSTRRGQWSRAVSCDRRRLSPECTPDANVTSV